MSDAALRALERSAKTDPEAAVRLRIERWRAGYDVGFEVGDLVLRFAAYEGLTAHVGERGRIERGEGDFSGQHIFRVRFRPSRAEGGVIHLVDGTWGCHVSTLKLVEPAGVST